MYHPTTMAALADARRQDLLRESAGSWRSDRPTRRPRRHPVRLVAHPRLVTAAVSLLVALGVSGAI